MVTVGIDLASKPERTAVARVRWEQGVAVVEYVQCGTDDPTLTDDDAPLIAAIEQADKVGIDVPFGWPDAFVNAVAGYSATGRWPTTTIVPSKTNKPLYFRATDHHIRDHNPSKPWPWPLSVSSDRIAIPAMRAAALFTRLADAGKPVARDGSGKIVEVYPAAAIRIWWGSQAARRYKGKENRDARCKLLDQVIGSTVDWLRVTDDAHALCEKTDDALDALIAALIARAAAVGQCEPIPDHLSAIARREGWIALPKPKALSVLAQDVA